MPNIASILKEEITRLARRELRREVEGLKKASTRHRSEIAALKRDITRLEKLVKRLGKSLTRGHPSDVASETTTQMRFSAKGLTSQRKRLGLSAADFGTLIGVTAQTIYNWEAGKSRPRPQQLEALAKVKKMGKRQASALLTADRSED